ncbi:MAG: hypothetical protein ACXABK_02775 [Candidatus Heimdallarchaeaceae archaeon]|jgi:hypothetical protein
MSPDEQPSEFARPALYLGAFLLSLVGGILFFTVEFGWWYNGTSYPDFALYGVYVEWYGKLILVLMGLIYLFVAFVSLWKLYPFIQLPENFAKNIHNYAFFSAIGVVILTVITAIIFAAQVTDALDQPNNYFINIGKYFP